MLGQQFNDMVMQLSFIKPDKIAPLQHNTSRPADPFTHVNVRLATLATYHVWYHVHLASRNITWPAKPLARQELTGTRLQAGQQI